VQAAPGAVDAVDELTRYRPVSEGEVAGVAVGACLEKYRSRCVDCE
jgi:hypothetical protein